MESNDCQGSERIGSFSQLLLVTVNFPQPPETSHHWHQVKKEETKRQQGSNFGVEEMGGESGT